MLRYISITVLLTERFDLDYTKGESPGNRSLPLRLLMRNRGQWRMMTCVRPVCVHLFLDDVVCSLRVTRPLLSFSFHRCFVVVFCFCFQFGSSSHWRFRTSVIYFAPLPCFSSLRLAEFNRVVETLTVFVLCFQSRLKTSPSSSPSRSSFDIISGGG